MKLLPNENKLITSNLNKVVLTNYRIQMTDTLWGQSYNVSMFLEDISSMEIKFKNNLILLALSVAAMISGLMMPGGYRESSPMLPFVVVAGILFIIWWFTRKHVISISSNGGATLAFEIKGMSKGSIDSFVSDVSLAKLNRINELHKI
jgi:hypothetical protein